MQIMCIVALLTVSPKQILTLFGNSEVWEGATDYPTAHTTSDSLRKLRHAKFSKC